MKDLEIYNMLDNNNKNHVCGALHLRQFFTYFVSFKEEVTEKNIGFGMRETQIQYPGLQYMSHSFRSQPLELSLSFLICIIGGGRRPCQKSLLILRWRNSVKNA